MEIGDEVSQGNRGGREGWERGMERWRDRGWREGWARWRERGMGTVIEVGEKLNGLVGVGKEHTDMGYLKFQN